jgi:glycosyltransferase involved in cell wall biosynthesis
MNDNTAPESQQLPIRIAVFMGEFIPGGQKTVVLNYYYSIDKSKIQFDFFIGAGISEREISEIEALGGRIFILPRITNILGFINQAQKILRANRYRIVHCYLNTLDVFPLFAAWLARVPVRISESITTAHPGELKTILKWMLRPFGKLFPTNLAANSLCAAKWSFGEKRLTKCRIIRNGIDLEKYHFDAQLRKTMRGKLGYDDKFIIGHIGRYAFQKNHSFLIDIFAKVHELDNAARLALVGYGSLKDEIFYKIERLGLSEYVYDIGATEDILQYYHAMDVFVLPSFYEGLPVVAIEAQACCLPCVVSEEVTPESKITDIVEFVSLYDSTEVWAEKILRYKKYSRYRTDEQVRSSGYDIKKEATLLEEYYNSLL